MRLVLRGGRIWFLRYSGFHFVSFRSDPEQKVAPYSFGPLRWHFFLLLKNFDSMQRNSKTRFYHSAETSAIESSSKSGLEKVFKSFKF